MSLLFSTNLFAKQPTIELIQADADAGFNFPYVLRSPDLPNNKKKVVLLVETNNSGNNDDYQQQINAALHFAANKGIGPVAAQNLDVPLLVPVFPRTKSEAHVYTHALDRDTLTTTDKNLIRIDQQLLNMISDAQNRLGRKGIYTRKRAVLVGFSASGTFANRIAMLYPKRVLAVVSGGINAFPMLPVSEYGGESLNYPLGVGDISEFVQGGFDLDTWREIPQFIFMGHKDDNDAVAYDDAYSPTDRTTIHAVIGSEMDERWRTAQKIYLDSGSNSTFVTYGRMGHWTDTRVANDVANFIRYQTWNGT
ncbi:MAG: hypothetical protein ACE37D_15245 [Pseudomonadales bacterium]